MPTTLQLVHSYDPPLFVGSVVIAVFASYVALRLVGRVSEVGTRGNEVRWLGAASAAMGVGIWSMHFTGMLALRLPVPVGYGLGLTLLSAAIAVVASLLALAVVKRDRVSGPQLAGAAALMGVAISGMHYTGMAAMRVPGEMFYRADLLGTSVAIAIVASGAALWLALRFRGTETKAAHWGKLFAGLVMGLAISGMHYTGMAAARFRNLDTDAALPGGLLFTDWLATGVALATLAVLGLALIAAQVDRRLAAAYTSDLREWKRRYEALMTEIYDVVTVLDEEGVIRYESPSIAHVFGYDADDRVGRSMFELVHPDDVDQAAEAFEAILATPGEERTLQYRLKAADGSWRSVESTGVVPDREDLGPLIVTRDITDRALAEQKYRTIFDTNPSLIGLTTLEDGRFLEVNEAFEEYLGHPREEAVGKTAGELGIWADPGERDRIVARLRETGAVYNHEVRFRSRDGDIVNVIFSGSVLEIEGESCLVGVAQDITERKAFEAELQRRALHDSLTDLPNRALFGDRLRHAVERAGREGTEVAVLFLDVDRFKAVNDSLGHQAGDQVLRAIAARLVDALRETDTVARVGGDEFAVLLESLTSLRGIEQAARRIWRAFEPPFAADGNEFSLSAAIGVAHTGLQYETPDDLVRLADAAMYRVKQGELTEFHVFDPDQDRDVTERLQREGALKRAIREDEFVVHFQPLVRLATGDVVGAESLVRWLDPERGLVPPAEFIPLAEETGLVVPLGRKVLDLALRQTSRWLRSGLVAPGEFRLSVNLSAREYQEEDLIRAVVEATGRASVPLSMLTLEITETIAVTGRDRLEPLRARGLQVAIDDFGTGYSSLEYLRHLEADILKVDRSFISGLEQRNRDEAIVRGVLSLSHDMGMNVIAEGVETEAQAEWLRDARCPEAQGFFFGAPMPADEFERLLSDVDDAVAAG